MSSRPGALCLVVLASAAASALGPVGCTTTAIVEADSSDRHDGSSFVTRLSAHPPTWLTLSEVRLTGDDGLQAFAAGLRVPDDSETNVGAIRLRFILDDATIDLAAARHDPASEESMQITFPISSFDLATLAEADAVRVGIRNGRDETVYTLDAAQRAKIAEFHRDHVLPALAEGAAGHDRQLSQIREAMDYRHPETRRFAIELAKSHPGHFDLEQACAIYTHVREHWQYADDPQGVDHFARASETIRIGLAGDCDDFAILVAAAIEAIGGRTRITFGYRPDSAHAYAEVFCGTGDDAAERAKETVQAASRVWYQRALGVGGVESVACRRDDEGGVWLNLDWWGEYPGGRYIDAEIRTVIFHPRDDRYEFGTMRRDATRSRKR